MVVDTNSTSTLWYSFEWSWLALKGKVVLESKHFCTGDRLLGLVVKASASRVEVLGSIPTCDMGIFLDWVISVTSKLALQWLPCQAPGIIILWLGEVESLICNFYLSVASRDLSVASCTNVWADPSWDTLACCWDVKQTTTQFVPILKSLVWLDLEQSHHKRESNPRSSPLETDTFTTKPARRCI